MSEEKRTLVTKADLMSLINERPSEIYIILRDFLKKKNITRPSDELLQDLAVGFLEYSRHFDEKHGVRPLTYLYKCLDGILKRRGKLNSLVRPSMAYHAKILQAVHLFTKEHQTDKLSLQTIADMVGCPIEAVLRSVTGIYSVDTLVTEDSEGGNPWDILLTKENKGLQQDHAEEIEDRDFIDHLLSFLSEEEKFIVQSRVGMLPKQSLEDLGKTFDLSKERIRQIQNKAYDKLRRVLLPLSSEKDAARLLRMIVEYELGTEDESDQSL